MPVHALARVEDGGVVRRVVLGGWQRLYHIGRDHRWQRRGCSSIVGRHADHKWFVGNVVLQRRRECCGAVRVGVFCIVYIGGHGVVGVGKGGVVEEVVGPGGGGRTC